MASISVVINTLNEADGLPKVIASVKNLADEIIVCDMESTDNTKEIAKKLGAKVFTHKRLPYVEPARNFGISKATSDWILVLDVDEEISPNLAKKIIEIVKSPTADYYRIPRKNIIFGHWMKHTRWWPDYNIRFFKKGSVVWNEAIHGVPFTQGKGSDIEPNEDFAIIHNNYEDIDEYIEHTLRYSKVQSKELIKNGYQFSWHDIVSKPVNEFLSRYFVGEGYKDGLHGLILSLLQSFSELITYIRVWNYKEENITKNEIKNEFNKNISHLKWWIRKDFSWFKNLVSR